MDSVNGGPLSVCKLKQGWERAELRGGDGKRYKQVTRGKRFVLNILAPNLFRDYILLSDFGPLGETIEGITVFPAP